MNQNFKYALPVSLILVLLVFTVCTGCVSMRMPAPANADDTLVIIPLLCLNTRITEFDGEVGYQINMENVDTGKALSFSVNVRSGYGYKYIRGIPPGRYSIKEYIPHGLVGLVGSKPIHVRDYLVVQKGMMTLFPAKVAIMIFSRYYNGQQISTFYVEFPEIDAQQRERILDVLKHDDNYPLW